jgi:protein SCO1/2
MVLVLSAAAVACVDAPLRGTVVDPPKPLPDVRLTTSTGAALSLAGGKPTFVFFGYTKCPDVCPTTLADWSRVRQRLGAEANKVQFVFVSVDPERDSPAVAQQYASNFDSAIVGVSPDSATSATLQRALGASSFREGTGSDANYLVAHSAQTFLIDGRGNLVAFYSFGSGWDVMLHDVETLL